MNLLEIIVTFVGAATLWRGFPAPTICLSSQSALYGSKMGIIVTLGLCTGLIVHTVVFAGVAVIFQTSQLAFTALKVIGAAYLLYLAYRAFRARPEPLSDDGGKPRPLWRMYTRGIVMNVTNPKVAIFFLAFLPQFASPARGDIVLQMLLLGAIFIVCAFASFAVISFLAGSLSSWLRRSSRGQIVLNRVAGFIFVGLAAKLVAAHR